MSKTPAHNEKASKASSKALKMELTNPPLSSWQTHCPPVSQSNVPSYIPMNNNDDIDPLFLNPSFPTSPQIGHNYVVSCLLRYSIKELENSPEICFASVFVLH